jgi:hypothetical protein
VRIIERKTRLEDHRFSLEYDACRSEMALLSPGSQLHDKEYELQKYEEKYKQLKSDISIKLRLLDENQVGLHKTSYRWSRQFSFVFLE